MVLAVPVAVRFLQRGNKELSRNMSSYLSLAAIAKADLLAEHTEAITLSVLGGRTHTHTFTHKNEWILLYAHTVWTYTPSCCLLDVAVHQERCFSESFISLGLMLCNYCPLLLHIDIDPLAQLKKCVCASSGDFKEKESHSRSLADGPRMNLEGILEQSVIVFI